MAFTELTENRPRGERKGETRVKKSSGERDKANERAARTLAGRGENKGRKRLRIKKRGLLREQRGVERGGEEIRVEG